MKAAVLASPGNVEIQNLPDPIPASGEVRVKVAYCGICGSDLPRVFANAAHSYPIVLGHEFSGVIDMVGEGVCESRVGQAVACAPLLPCHKCVDCLQGHPAQCANYSFIGSRRNGALAQYVCLPQGNAVPCEGVPLKLAALTEPSTVALHGLMHMGLRPGGHVAVVGAGTIGLLTMMWAKLLGAHSVTAFDIAEKRLETALSLYADCAFLSSNEAAAIKAVNGRGYDAVIETAGAASAMSLCFRLAARRAQLCFIGTSTSQVAFTHRDFELMNRREFTLTGSWMSYSAPFPGSEWAMACAEGRAPSQALIGRVLPLSSAMEGFELAKSGGAAGRVLIEI